MPKVVHTMERMDIEDMVDLDPKMNDEVRLEPIANTEKCVFGVTGGKFLGFLLTHRDINANPDKGWTLLEMRSPTNFKEVQQLMGKLTSLSRFMPKLVEKLRSIIRLMKKTNSFSWDDMCEKSSVELNQFLSFPLVLHKTT